MRFQPEVLRCLRSFEHDITSPFLAFLRITFDMLGSETIKWDIVGGMNGDQLALKMGGQFGELDANVAQCFEEVIAVGLGGGRFIDINQAGINDELYAFETKGFGPFCDIFEIVEGGFVRNVLCNENGGTFDGAHGGGGVLFLGEIDSWFGCR